jgi:hypothetical protein
MRRAGPATASPFLSLEFENTEKTKVEKFLEILTALTPVRKNIFH